MHLWFKQFAFSFKPILMSRSNSVRPTCALTRPIGDTGSGNNYHRPGVLYSGRLGFRGPWQSINRRCIPESKTSAVVIAVVLRPPSSSSSSHRHRVLPNGCSPPPRPVAQNSLTRTMRSARCRLLKGAFYRRTLRYFPHGQQTNSRGRQRLIYHAH